MQRKLVVTLDSIGVLIDATAEDAATEIAIARDFIRRLSPSRSERSPRGNSPAAASTKTLSGRILGLGAGYFAEPRESTEISKDLARAGYHYEDVRVRVELRRVVRRGLLRRIGDGTKASPYKYVNS